jgi:hypothetical protein
MRSLLPPVVGESIGLGLKAVVLDELERRVRRKIRRVDTLDPSEGCFDLDLSSSGGVYEWRTGQRHDTDVRNIILSSHSELRGVGAVESEKKGRRGELERAATFARSRLTMVTWLISQPFGRS